MSEKRADFALIRCPLDGKWELVDIFWGVSLAEVESSAAAMVKRGEKFRTRDSFYLAEIKSQFKVESLVSEYDYQKQLAALLKRRDAMLALQREEE